MYHKSTIESSVALGNLRFPRSRIFCKSVRRIRTPSISKLIRCAKPRPGFQKNLRGDNEIRTRDLLLARQALSQLSYTPILIFCFRMGLSGHYLLSRMVKNGLKWTRTTDLTLIRRAL